METQLNIKAEYSEVNPTKKSQKSKYLVLGIFAIALASAFLAFSYGLFSDQAQTQVLVERSYNEDKNIVYLHKLKFCLSIGAEMNLQNNCSIVESLIGFQFLNKSQSDIYLLGIVVPLNSEATKDLELSQKIEILKDQNLEILFNAIQRNLDAVEDRFILQLDRQFNVKNIFVSGKIDKSQIANYKTIAQQFAPNLKVDLFNRKSKFNSFKRMLGFTEATPDEKEDLGLIEKDRNYKMENDMTTINVKYDKSSIVNPKDNGVVFSSFNYDENANFNSKEGLLTQSSLIQKGSVSSESDISFYSHSELGLIKKTTPIEFNSDNLNSYEWIALDSLSENIEIIAPSERILAAKPYTINNPQQLTFYSIPINTQTIHTNKLNTYLLIKLSKVWLTNVDPNSAFGKKYSDKIDSNSMSAYQIEFSFCVDRTNLDNNQKVTYVIYAYSTEWGILDIYDINRMLGNVASENTLEWIAGRFQGMVTKTRELFQLLNSNLIKYDNTVFTVCVTYGAQFCFSVKINLQVASVFDINNVDEFNAKAKEWFNQLQWFTSSVYQTCMTQLFKLIDFNFNFKAGIKPTFTVRPELAVYPPVKIAGIAIRGYLSVPATGAFVGLSLKFNFKTLGVKLYFQISGAIAVKLGAYIQVPKCLDTAVETIVNIAKQGLTVGGTIDNIAKEIFNQLMNKAWDIAKSIWDKCSSALKIDKNTWDCGSKVLKGDYSCALSNVALSDGVPLYEWSYTAWKIENQFTMYDNQKWI